MCEMINSYQNLFVEYAYSGKDDFYNNHRIAKKSFDEAYRRAKVGRWWKRLFGGSNQLQVLSHQPATSRGKSKNMPVPLDKIIGSESRSEDFDEKFQPLKKNNRERWINIAVARRKGVVLPAVELVQDGENFYVRDGHHRISVARSMGEVDIDAQLVN
jgi:hypothetical protein